jgi:hypothetical protein
MSQNMVRNMQDCVTQLIVNKMYICRTIDIEKKMYGMNNIKFISQ